jgi:hypothetical protein
MVADAWGRCRRAARHPRADDPPTVWALAIVQGQVVAVAKLAGCYRDR